MTNPQDLTIVVDGTAITGWEAVEVTRSAESFPNSFAISASTLDGKLAATASAGKRCTVLLGNDLVVTGYIDRDIQNGQPNSHQLTLLGRGRTQDLVDCSAEWPTHQMIEGDALTIASRIAQPYGINVRLGEGSTPGDRVPAWNLNFGETGADIVQRVARNAGLLAYEDADGALVLGTAGIREAASGVVYGRNVEAWSVENSMDQRFSDIVCCGQSMDTLGDLGGNTFFHQESDPNVARHRLMYLVLESVADDPQGFTIKKAIWEVARRAGRSMVTRVTVDSWRDSAGRLWEPNTLLPVEVPGNRAGSPLCLSSVTFRRTNETGTTAELVLLPKNAFTPEPIVLQPVSTADIAPPPGPGG